MTSTTASEILRHTTTFISDILSKSELRHSLLSTLRLKIPPSDQTSLKPLNLAAEALENAISTDNFSIKSSSLRLAKNLLFSNPKNPFSSFLSSLIYGLTNQRSNAALSLLDVFISDPFSARSEIAPVIFEELFLIHIVPVLQCFNTKRSTILSGEKDTEFSLCDESVIFPCTKSLSRMSGDQALEMRELERNYEEVLDDNCRVVAEYLKEVVKSKDDSGILIKKPLVILDKAREFEDFDCSEEEEDIKTEELGFRNGRYNPIWTEEESSTEISIRSTKFLPFYPQRVSPHNNFAKQKPSDKNSANSSSSSESEDEIKDKNINMALLDSAKTQIQKQKQPKSIISNPMADSGIPPGGGNGKHTPPKDFVCPITSNLFDDPVTLETGQTYERRAIHEWLERGNLSCPITRQKLQSGQLPKTNYVLKRLIASWKEQNSVIRLDKPDSLSDQTEPATVKTALELSTSPNSVISQVTIDGDMNGLRQAIATLCTSESLNETETAALRIEQFWNDGNAEISIQTMLSKPPVINGFMEILFNSVNPQVLKSMIVLLSELGLKENSVIQTLTQVESDVDCIMALFKNGLLEAVVLIYLLGPSRIGLIEMEMVGSLIKVIKSREDEFVKMNLKPKAAATILLGQIVGDGKEVSVCSSIANAVVAEQGIETVVGSLGGETAEERIAAVGVLLACIQAEGKCRSIIVDKAELAPVLESFMDAADGQRFLIIQFLAELVKLNRRTLNEQVLHIIKDEGAYSTMHTLLVYLQIADHDQCPVVAGLLLQLDLLEEPRKMSIYREEAIDALILCLRNSSFPTAQIAAAETIVSLQGRFSAAGEPLNRALLLKRAGIDKSYRKRMRRDHLSNSLEEFEETTKEEERVADEWERKMAFVLVSHEFGLLFEALAEGLKSKNEALHSACLVSATWLTHMLRVLPDTGIQGAAQFCLLKHFASLFISATDIEDKALSLLALSSFIRDPEARQSLSSYMKDIMRGLRELKKASPLAFEILKVLSEGNDSSSELWNHKELVQVDCSENGEVLCIVYFKDKIFSGHSDGTIKVWTGRGSILHLVQEIQEHTKAVMSLVVSESGEKLYSGSLDKTIKVWSIGNDTIHCVQVHDMKDQVHNLVVAKSILCFIPHGAGVKIRSWEGESKLLNTSKYIKCLALVRGKLYCGCHDNSIQEIDLPTGTLSSIQSGSRKLLGKGNPIHALQVHSGQIFTASSPLDGAAVKIWSESSYSMIGSLPTLLDVRTMAISSELVYLGGKGGTVEIWDRDKQNRVDTLQTGRNCKVICMVLDENEEILIIGTSDGRIQSWGLN